MTLYLLTGAAGFLGGNILKKLLADGQSVRALVLPGDKYASRIPEGVEVVTGDVTDPADLERFFDVPAGTERVVIHAAGIVTIYPGFSQKVWDVNVGGTRAVLEMCEKTGSKLVYVSSVHAIPPAPKGKEMDENAEFNPDLIRGFYGKTKAAATRLVLQAARERGVKACVVFPSGLCGPGDTERGHVTQMLVDCAGGRLPAGIEGGYDFADVRDVAEGVIAAAKRGEPGEGYILGNRVVSVREIFRAVHELTGAKLVKMMFPIPVAEAVTPFFEAYYKIKKRPPLFTKYSLYTLRSNSNFSHEKARRVLGYAVRPFSETLADSLAWLRAEGRI